jgi:hypothetical protein
MAGVLEQLIRPQKRAVVHRASRADIKVLELETAKAILAEVFRIRVSEVDEMIQNHFEAHYEEARYEVDGLWPREFWLASENISRSVF